MLIDAYFKQISITLADAAIIQHADMDYDRRDKSTGFIRGDVIFTERSVLHIREFVNVMDGV